MGDLDTCGWVVLRGVKVTKTIVQKIDEITETGK